MDALEKTKALGRVFLPVEALEPNKDNPNTMSDAEFNMLSDNIEKTGITDPIFVRLISPGQYRIVGGHHRWEVAKLLGFVEVPCTVIDDPEFDDDAEKYQMVRMNVIRGRMTPDKFLKLYNSLNKKHGAEIMAEAFGFVDEEQFKKLTKQMSATLPPELQGDFEKAAKEIKTIDGLSKLLNGMFSKYGNTLDYNFMLLDYGGRDSVWIRMAASEKKKLVSLGYKCVDGSVSLDSVLNGLIDFSLSDKGSQILAQLIKEGKKVTLSDGIELPTLENLDEHPKGHY
jgi:ParB/RepB/Spo0J family partition protein